MINDVSCETTYNPIPYREISHRRERRDRRDYLSFSFSAFSAFSAVNCYVSFMISLDARGQRRRSYETSKFLVRSNWSPWRPAAGLTPDTPGPDLTLYEPGRQDIIGIAYSEQ